MGVRRSRLAAMAVAVVTAMGVTATGLSGLATAGAAAQASLLANPGFETGSLTGWSCSPLGRVVTSPVHSGSYALAGAVSGSDDAQCTQSVSVQPSTAYTLSGWVQGNYVYLGDRHERHEQLDPVGVFVDPALHVVHHWRRHHERDRLRAWLVRTGQLLRR